MNLNISNLITSESKIRGFPESMLNIELNLSVAQEAFNSACEAYDDYSKVIDNIATLNTVSRRFSSKTSAEVLTALIGNQLSGMSMEGFLKDAWDTLVESVVWIWEKFKEFISWIWEKITGMFSAAKARTQSAFDFARRHPEIDLGDIIVVVTESLQSSIESDGESSQPRGESPSILLKICKACPKVRIPESSRKALGLPDDDDVKSLIGKVLFVADYIVTNVNTEMTRMVLEIKRIPESNDVDGEWSEFKRRIYGEEPKTNQINHASTTSTMAQQSIDAEFASKGNQALVQFAKDPTKYCELYVHKYSPVTLGDIGKTLEFLQGQSKRITDFSKAMETRLSNMKDAIKKAAVEVQNVTDNTNKDQRDNILRLFNKCLYTVKEIMRIVVRLGQFVVADIQRICSKSSLILAG